MRQLFLFFEIDLLLCSNVESIWVRVVFHVLNDLLHIFLHAFNFVVLLGME